MEKKFGPDKLIKEAGKDMSLLDTILNISTHSMKKFNSKCFVQHNTKGLGFKSIRLNHARYSITTFPDGIFVL